MTKISISFLNILSATIKVGRNKSVKDSYVANYFKGFKRTAQKVGEEGVELSVAHASGDGMKF